jgi:hypothetical protein
MHMADPAPAGSDVSAGTYRCTTIAPTAGPAMIATLLIVSSIALPAARSSSPSSCGSMAAVAGSYVDAVTDSVAAMAIAAQAGALAATATANPLINANRRRSAATITRTRSNRSATTPP